MEEEAWFPEPEEETEPPEPNKPETAPPVVATAVATDVAPAASNVAPQPEAADEAPDPGPAKVAPQPKPAPKAEKPRPPADPPADPADASPSKLAEDADPEPPASDPVVDDPVPPPPKAAPPVAPKPKAPPVEPLNGEYRYGGGETQKNRVAEAVEAVVSQMSVISRGIARKRLLAGATPVRAVELRIDGSDVTAVFDGRRYQAKLGGAAVDVTSASGDRLKFKVRRRKDQLMLAFTGDRGGKTYVMRVDDKDRLRMRVTIHSSSLPESVVYQLTYRRA